MAIVKANKIQFDDEPQSGVISANQIQFDDEVDGGIIPANQIKFDDENMARPTFTAPDDPNSAMLDAGLVDTETEGNIIPWSKALGKGVAHAVTSTAPSMVNAVGRQFVDRARSLNEAGATGLLDSDQEVESPEYTKNFQKNLSDRLGVGVDVWQASGKPLELPPTATKGEQRAFGAGESLGLVGTAIPFGAVGGPAALGIGTSGQKYDELIKAGVDPDRANKAAIISGIAEFVPELFSFRIGLSKKIPFLQKLIKGQVSEILGESGTAGTQLASDLWAMNPDATKEQIAEKYASEIGDTLKETVIQTLIQSPIQSAAMHGVSKIADLKVQTADTIAKIQEKLGIGTPASATDQPLSATATPSPAGQPTVVEGQEQPAAQGDIDIEGTVPRGTEEVTKSVSLSPLDIAREHVIKGNEQEGLSSEAVSRIAQNIAFDAGMPGFFRKEYIRPYAEKAIKHVQDTGEEISRTHLDIGNLTGVNLSKGHEAANKHIQDISEIIKQAYEEIIPAEQLDFGREGGDEMAVYGRGVSKYDLDRAAQSAKIKVEQYAKDNGLLQLPTKTKGVLKDVTLHINTASISEFLKNNPKATTQDFLTYNDAKLAKEAENVTRRETEETRTIAPEGQAAGVGGGLGPDNQQVRTETTAASPTEVTPQPSQQPATTTLSTRSKNEVEKALYTGKPVTQEELSQYPDLAKKYGKTVPKTALEYVRREQLKQSSGERTDKKTAEQLEDEYNLLKLGRITPPTANKPDTARTLSETTEKTAKTIDDFIDSSAPAAGLSVRPAFEKNVDDNLKLPGGEVKSVNPDVEKRWQESKGITQKSLLDRIKENLSHFKEQFKHFPGLDYKKDARTINILREFENVPEFSKKTAAEVTSGIVAGMGPKKYDVFTRNIILPDLIKDIDNGLYEERELPFGYQNKSEIEQDLATFKAVAEANPDIQAALKRRAEFNAVLKSQLVENELLPKEVLNDDSYFHHQVLMYMDAKKAAPGVSSKDVRTHKKGFQKGRTGSSKDFNTEYIESEFEYIAQAIAQLKTVETLKKVRTAADIALEVKKQAKEQGLENWRDAIPEDYTTWQPKPGTTFYKAVSIPERLVDEIMSGKMAEVSKDDLHAIIAQGAKNPEWVIPKRLAETLDNFRDFADEGFDRFVRATMASWKQWVLMNPLRVLKYNINNMSGDLDIAIAYDPRILKYFKEATGESWGHYNGKAMTKDMREALEYGVIGSGISLNEIPDIKEIGVFRILTGHNSGLVEKYWEKAKGLTTARENILRLAAYKYFKAEIAAGKKVYGASRPELVDAERDPNRKAAMLARDLIGDYGNISKAGEWLRNRMIPFYSWMEINTPRYIRLIKNLPKEGRTGQMASAAASKAAFSGAKLAVKASGLYALVMLWNAVALKMLDVSDDEERALYKDREQLHIILGRRKDGSIMTMRFQGAFSDMLDWVALGNAPAVASDLATGKKTAKEQLQDSAKAPINKLVNASHPILKTVGEVITGKSIYPDVFKPKPIRDRMEHAMRAITFDLPYDYITGKPRRGLSKDILSVIAYSNDPAEAAYWNTRKKVYEFLEGKGQESYGYTPTKRSNAMYYYKQAKRFGDEKAAEKYLKKYIELGGTPKGFLQSIERGSPLASLPKKYRDEFDASLSADDRRDIEISEKWYEQHMSVNDEDLEIMEKAMESVNK